MRRCRCGRRRRVDRSSDSPPAASATRRRPSLESSPTIGEWIQRIRKVLRYNRTEGKISGRDPDEVVGKDFFTEVAPCTNVREFAGRFREGVAQKDLNAVFPYRFDFLMDPTDVWVRLFYSEATDSAWVFVSRRRDSEDA